MIAPCSSDVEIRIIDLIQTQPILVGQVQHCQETQSWRYVVKLLVSSIKGLEGRTRVDQVLHLLLCFGDGNQLAPHIDVYVCAGDVGFHGFGIFLES